MSTDAPIDTPEPVETPEPAPEAATATTVDVTAELEKWKALARKNEQRAKENADKAKRLDEIEEASRTELEKAQARAERAEQAIREREEADAKAKAESERKAAISGLVKEVAEATGIPAAALHGESREEIEAVAAELKPLFPDVPVGSTAGVGGHRGDPIGAGELSADEIVAKATAR